jgi:hypothetical protein
MTKLQKANRKVNALLGQLATATDAERAKLTVEIKQARSDRDWMIAMGATR